MQIFPDLNDFTIKHEKGAAQLVWTSLPADLETPVSLAIKLKDEKYSCLFESVEQGRNRGRYSFLAIDPDLLWRCNKGKPEINRQPSVSLKKFQRDGDDVFASLRSVIKESQFKIPAGLPAMSSGLFGFMGYDMVRHMEKLPDENPEVVNIPEALFMRPRIVIIFDSVKDDMIIASPIFDLSVSAKKAYKAASDRIKQLLDRLADSALTQDYRKNRNKVESNKKLKVTSNTSRKEYHAMVEKAKEYIYAGDIFQVVPSQRFTVDFPYEGLQLYRVLRRMNPSPYSFYMNLNGFSLVGSSPEILVRVENKKATVRPIAGTRKRGVDKEEDDALVADLLADEKELSEHLMLIDLGRNDIGRVAEIGSVQVTEKMVIEYYSHVMHIVSNVEGKVRRNVDALDAVIAGFPVGTVSGAPKIRAMEIIDELEKEKRGFYAGGVGYFSANGGVDTCIALRTGLVKDGKLYVQAGGGVVADSDPELEYQESCNKAKALLKAAEEVADREW